MRRLDPIGSDHFPIVIKLSLLKSPKKSQVVPTSDQEDREEGEELLEEAKEKQKVEKREKVEESQDK